MGKVIFSQVCVCPQEGVVEVSGVPRPEQGTPSHLPSPSPGQDRGTPPLSPFLVRTGYTSLPFPPLPPVRTGVPLSPLLGQDRVHLAPLPLPLHQTGPGRLCGTWQYASWGSFSFTNTFTVTSNSLGL